MEKTDSLPIIMAQPQPIYLRYRKRQAIIWVLGSGGQVNWNPNLLTSGINIDGSIGRPGYISLGHELIGHGWLSNQGLLYYNAQYNGYDPYYQGVLKVEWQAVYLENQLRQEANITLRHIMVTDVIMTGLENL